MIKVLFIGLNNIFGGIERYFSNFISNYDSNNFEIGVVAYHNDYVCKDLIEKKEITIYPNCYEKDNNELIKIFSYYDIIHFNKNSACDIRMLKLAKKINKKVIWHSHNTGISVNNNFIYRLLHKINRKFVNKNVDLKLSCSDIAAEWMFGKNSNYIFMPNGVNVSSFNNISDEKTIQIRKKLNINEKIVFGNVCRFTKQKNLIRLIEIFFEIKKNNDNVALLLIGDGPEMVKLKKLTRKLGLENDIIFTGYIDNVSEYIEVINFFVVPSLYEGFPMSVIEAQASGKKVFCSNNITKQVAVTSGVYFFDLTDSNSAIADFIMKNVSDINKDIFNEFIESEFTVDKTVEKIQKIYFELV